MKQCIPTLQHANTPALHDSRLRACLSQAWRGAAHAFRFGLFSVAVAALLPLSAAASTYWWNGSGADNNWNTTANWTSDDGGVTYPDAATDTACFTGTVRTVVNMNGDKTVYRLVFTNSTVSTWNITNSTLTVADGGEIVCYTTAGTPYTITSKVNLLGNAAIRHPTGTSRRYLTVAGTITGTNTLTIAAQKYDWSWISIKGNNTGFLGKVVLTNGCIEMGHVSCFGTNATPVEIWPCPDRVSIMNPPNSTKPFVAYGDFSVRWGFTSWSSPIQLVSNATIYVQTGGGNACNMDGVISGTGNVSLEKAGALRGTAANTYNGWTIALGVPVNLDKTAGFDAVPGPLQIGSSTLSGQISLVKANQINDASIAYLWNAATSGKLSLNGLNETVGGLVTTGGVSQTAVAENLSASTACTLTVSNSTECTYGGIIRDGGSAKLNMTKTGAGTFYMNGWAQSTGPWVVNGGTLGGTGTYASAVSVASGGTLAPGTAGTAGTMVLNNGLTNAAGATLSFDLAYPNVVGSKTNDLISVTGSVSLDGTVNVAALTGFSPGGHKGDKWRLINYTGSLAGGGMTVGSVPSSTYTLGIDTATLGQVNLVILSNAVTPGTPASPSPTNNATSISDVGTVLDWADAQDADGYEVFLWKSTDSEPGTPTALVAVSQYTPSAMDMGTTYNWKVVATNSAYTATGPTWSFTTRNNPVPLTPDTPSPSDTATEVLVSTVL
ncbi:MAG: hypothetical protein WCK89_07225, partial [bacterium]